MEQKFLHAHHAIDLDAPDTNLTSDYEWFTEAAELYKEKMAAYRNGSLVLPPVTKSLAPNKYPIPIIVNGCGASGKDTFVDFLEQYLMRNNIAIARYSTVDMVYDAVYTLLSSDSRDSVDRSIECKDNDFRMLMSSIKDLWSDYCDGPFNYVMTTYNDIVDTNRKNPPMSDEDIHTRFVTYMVREPDEIRRTIHFFRRHGIPAITLMICGLTDPSDYTNHADRDVMKNIQYDVTYENLEGQMDQLEKHTHEFGDLINMIYLNNAYNLMIR